MKIVVQVRNTKTKEVTEAIFDRLPVLVGRSKICDLTINDPLASRQHCVIEADEGGQIRVLDLESANGTYSQGHKIQKRTLGVGDSFQIGDFEILIDRISRIYEESTVHDLTPVGAKLSPENTGTHVPPAPSPAPEQPAHLPETNELTLKTPSVVRIPTEKNQMRTKEWVQVSLFWKDSLIDIQCFDRGDTVEIGRSIENDFTIEYPSIPEVFSFLKIHPQGIEVNLHPAMTGMVETREGTESLDDLRKKARQTDFGFSTFVPFQDRCLLEIGPFSFFIRSVRLRITEPLEAPLVKEPLFSGILTTVASSFIVFMLILGSLAAAKQEEELENQPFVRLELPKELQPPPPPEKKAPPPEPRPQAKTGATATRARNLSGQEGAGAKAKGPEGARGRETGTAPSKAREIGFQTKKSPPKPATPKGAFGKETQRETARRGRRADQGTGTGKPKPKGEGQQAPSPTPKPQVRVEDQGVLGVLGESGGGGSASQGGELEGSGLGGNLEGALAGLERGSDSDSKGTGGRGNQGRDFGGGGDSLEVGGLGTKGKGGGRSGFGLGTSGKKGEADVSYVAEEVEVRDGLTREEIERVVRAHQNEIRACYEKALIQSGNMDLAGRLKVDWFVNRDGRAINVKKESDFGGQAGLFDCVSARIRSWQFPKPRGGLGAQVSWPFVFRRGG